MWYTYRVLFAQREEETVNDVVQLSLQMGVLVLLVVSTVVLLIAWTSHDTWRRSLTLVAFIAFVVMTLSGLAPEMVQWFGWLMEGGHVFWLLAPAGIYFILIMRSRHH